MNVNSPCHLIIMIDVNIHINDSADNDTMKMNNLIDSLNLMNKVLVPTHRLQNTLDVVLTDEAYTGNNSSEERYTFEITTSSSLVLPSYQMLLGD